MGKVQVRLKAHGDSIEHFGHQEQAVFLYGRIRHIGVALDTKQVSAAELAEYFLARAEKALALNAFLHIDRGLT